MTKKLHLEKNLTGHILDIGGGGEGVIGQIYGKQVTAVDTLKCELDEAPPGFNKTVMNALHLGFSTATFDNATAFFSFMFIKQPLHEPIFREVFRVLKPGGAFLIWDAEFENAEPFIIEVSIVYDGQESSPSYGIQREGVRQSVPLFIQQATQAGFDFTDSFTNKNSFFLTLRKPLA